MSLASSAARVLVRNGRVLACPYRTAEELLASCASPCAPPSVVLLDEDVVLLLLLFILLSPSLPLSLSSLADTYSTARTVGSRAVLDLGRHLARLADVPRLSDARASPLSAGAVDALVLPSVSRALHTLLRALPAHTEARLTLLLTTNAGGYDVVVYAEPLPSAPSWPVQCEVRSGARESPTVKSSVWVEARRRLKEEKHAQSEEVVLLGDDGRLYEGLSSNFLVLASDSDGDGALALYTAPAGTVLEVRLASAMRLCCACWC